MAKNVKGTARVQLTVELETSGWGDDCTIGQLHDQAAKDALSKMRIISANSHKAGYSFVIIGEPKVIGILTDRSEKEVNICA